MNFVRFTQEGDPELDVFIVPRHVVAVEELDYEGLTRISTTAFGHFCDYTVLGEIDEVVDKLKGFQSQPSTRRRRKT